MCSVGVFEECYFEALIGISERQLHVEGDLLNLRGIIFSTVSKVFPFSALDLECPSASENLSDQDSEASEASKEGIFDKIWRYVRDNNETCAYGLNYLTAISYTLIIGLVRYSDAEENVLLVYTFSTWITHQRQCTPRAA